MGVCCFVTIFHFPIPHVHSMFFECFLFYSCSKITSLKCGQEPSERFRKEERGVSPLFAPSDQLA